MKNNICLGGGCFWGLEDLLAKVDGVLETRVGYSGGSEEDAIYDRVKKGNTGHAEAVKVTYNSDILSLENLLDYFFHIHDPSQIDGQGNDLGSQYTSVIFVTTEEEAKIAYQVIERWNNLKRWPRPLSTKVVLNKPFYLAEEYHQKYLQKHPHGYSCHFYRSF